MSQTGLIVALVLGVLGTLLLAENMSDRRVVALFAIAYLVGLVFFAKRKPKTSLKHDSDLCLSLGHILHNETPNKERDTQLVFFRQEHACASAYWSGRYINQDTSFQLSDESLTAVTEIFDALFVYYRDNRLGHWNVAHFYLLAGKKKFNLNVSYDHALAHQEISFEDYMKRYM